MIKAYDIALIPPKDIVEKCYEINETIKERKNIDFRRHGQLPHITLLMGGVEEMEVNRIESELKDLIENLEPIEITITGIEIGKFASGLVVADDPKLNELHAEIFRQFKDRFDNEVEINGIIGLPDATQITADIINNYRTKSVLENFDPHITIGDGTPQAGDIPRMTFTSKDLRLAKMGNYCTFMAKY